MGVTAPLVSSRVLSWRLRVLRLRMDVVQVLTNFQIFDYGGKVGRRERS